MIKIKKNKFNILVLGDTQVGKTSMIEVFRENTFNPYEYPTIGLETFTDTMNIEGNDYKFKIFDASGREKFKNILIPKLRLADAYILVFSVDNKETLKKIDFWLHTIDETVKLKKLKILVGNKVDIGKRNITNQEAVNFAKERKLKYFETSAKTGFTIKETFNQIINELYEANKQYELIDAL